VIGQYKASFTFQTTSNSIADYRVLGRFLQTSTRISSPSCKGCDRTRWKLSQCISVHDKSEDSPCRQTAFGYREISFI